MWRCVAVLALLSVSAAALRPPGRIVVVGGGFGGVYTALKLSSYPWPRKQKPQITLVDPKDEFVFLPLLYDYAVGDAGAAEMAPTFESLFKDKNVDVVKGEVDEIFPEDQSLTLKDGAALPFDYVVLSPGAVPNLDAAPGVRDLASTFYTLDDAHELRSVLQLCAADRKKRRRAVVIGGGYSGVELACSLAESQRMDVTLVNRGPEVLASAPEGNRAAAAKSLAASGVEVLTDASVEEMSATDNDDAADPLREKVVRLEDGRELEADLVYWTAGTRPAGVMSRLNGVEGADGTARIEVDDTLRVPGTEGRVFGVGDAFIARSGGGAVVPASAQVAFQQADYAAHNIWALLTTPPTRRPALLEFRYLGLGEMMTLGTPTKASVATPFGVSVQGAIAGLARRVVYAARMPTLGSAAGASWGFSSKLVRRAFRRTTPKN